MPPSELEQQPTEAPASGGNDGTTKRHSASFWFIILSINVASFLAFLEGTIVSTALPIIVNDLHGVDFVWVATAYNLAAASMMPSTGALAQILGRKWVLAGSLVLFSIGSALCGAAL